MSMFPFSGFLKANITVQKFCRLLRLPQRNQVLQNSSTASLASLFFPIHPFLSLQHFSCCLSLLPLHFILTLIEIVVNCAFHVRRHICHDASHQTAVRLSCAFHAHRRICHDPAFFSSCYSIIAFFCPLLYHVSGPIIKNHFFCHKPYIFLSKSIGGNHYEYKK